MTHDIPSTDDRVNAVLSPGRLTRRLLIAALVLGYLGAAALCVFGIHQCLLGRMF